MSEYIHIGKIVAAHGIGGQIIIEHALGKPINFKGIDAIFVEKNTASFIPYFITSAVAKTDTLTHLQIEGIQNREATQILISKKVWLPQAEFQQLVDKSSPLALLGYMVKENGNKHWLCNNKILTEWTSNESWTFLSGKLPLSDMEDAFESWTFPSKESAKEHFNDRSFDEDW